MLGVPAFWGAWWVGVIRPPPAEAVTRGGGSHSIPVRRDDFTKPGLGLAAVADALHGTTPAKESASRASPATSQRLCTAVFWSAVQIVG